MVDTNEKKDIVEAGSATPAEQPVTPAVAEETQVSAKGSDKPKAPAKTKNAPKKAPVVKAAADREATEPTAEARAEEMVELRSADGRVLEASIGDSTWKGKVIQVPAHQAGDVRRLLEAGGFFLKD